MAATVFAAGAFVLAAMAEWRRWRERPKWSWAAESGEHRDHPGKYRISLQLLADAPAHHVTVEGVGLELWHGHHDHDHDRRSWPYLGMVSPLDPPLVTYVEGDGTTELPGVVVTWQIPPMRTERFMAQDIPVGVDAAFGQPYPLWVPRPWELRWWQQRWRAVRRRLRRGRGTGPTA